MTVHTQRHRRILDRPRAQGNGLRAAVVGALLCCLALAPAPAPDWVSASAPPTAG